MNESDLRADSVSDTATAFEARIPEDYCLGDLLEGMTLEQMEALGREIFDLPDEEEGQSAEPEPPEASAASEAVSGISETPKPSESQSPPAKRVPSAEDLVEQALEKHRVPLPKELRPALLAELQDACGQALNQHHQQLLDFVLNRLTTPFERETANCANPEFVKTLCNAIDLNGMRFAMESPLEVTACQGVQLTLVLAVGLAQQRAQPATLVPWCDVHKLFADYLRLLMVPRKERSDNDQAYFDLLGRVTEKPMLRPPAQTPRAHAVLELARTLPNFAEAITHMAEQLALHRMRQGAVFQPPPMLLLGPPGVGKSHFAQALAKLLGSTVHTLQLASQTSGWVLGGLDRGWGNARPGQLFEALAHGDTMAPVIVLDEIDKACTDARSHPLGPLYALLEPMTACKFRDEFVDFTVDTSQVIWIATANDEHAIPPALLSRFVVFRIEAPKGDEVGVVLQTMYRQAAAGIPGVPQLMPPAWQVTCRKLSLRASRIAIGKALGRAVLRADLRGAGAVELLAEDMQPTDESRRQMRMGF